nr:hypothetical protein [Tanacetum cinerariifolium]
MSDMIVLLNDLSYIPPNNEQNEPTQGDIGETSNELTQAKRNEFQELYASANKKLYPGCDYVTRLDFMAKFTNFKVKGDNNKDVHFCPVCKTSRWKDSNTPGKKVPKKVLRYFLIIPRLQRLYKSSHTAKEMTWHATGKCTEPGKMQHPVDGKAWKNFDTKYPNFAKEPRNVRLGLAANGFNPFRNLSQAYSIWSMILTTYNLPSWLCMQESSFMPKLLILGPKSPGKDIDVYLRPLIDDLKVLWALKGFETINVATGQKFNMRAMVLMIINDFPARSSLSGWSGQGYKACPTCIEDTPSVRIPEIDTYRSQFKSKFPNKDMKEEFPDWFGSQIRQRHVDNDPDVSAASELFALAYGSTPTPISVNSYVVNDARFVVHSSDEHRTTQNSGICSPGGRMEKCIMKIVERVNHKKFSNGGVIVVEEDPDVIHFNNSSDLLLSTSLNDLDDVTLRIDGQSTKVDASPDVINLAKDDDIIDDEGALLYDLADSDD